MKVKIKMIHHTIRKMTLIRKVNVNRNLQITRVSTYKCTAKLINTIYNKKVIDNIAIRIAPILMSKGNLHQIINHIMANKMCRSPLIHKMAKRYRINLQKLMKHLKIKNLVNILMKVYMSLNKINFQIRVQLMSINNY